MNDTLHSIKKNRNKQKLKNLKDILTRNLQNDLKKTGLFLLTLPTGFGKTFYVILYIIYHIKNNFTQRIWFTTNLKKNLPVEELYKQLGAKVFSKNVLFLNSYTESAKIFFNENQFDAPFPFNQWETYKSLKKWVKANEKVPKDSDYKDFLYKELRKSENNFRFQLKNYLSKEDFFHKNDSEEDRLLIIRDSKELHWIEKMYPSVAYFEKRIILCSIDKFYGYVDTIIGPNIQITSPKNIKEDIVFIDEFDATKTNILNSIAKNATRFNQDILGLFISVFRGMSSRKLPQDILKNFQPKEISAIKRIFKNLNEIGNDLYVDFDFNARFFYNPNYENKRAFIFHDFQYHTVINSSERNNQRKYLSRELTEDKVNDIQILSEKPELDNENMLILLNRLRGYLNLFARFVLDFSEIYKVHHDQSKNNNDATQIGLENAIRTTLELFDVNGKRVQDYFIDLIFQRTNINYGTMYGQFDQSPLNKGFRYYDILNKKSHNANTKILLADTLTTPETWLLNLCNNAKVVGISATASFESPLSNYSLYHLQHHLGEKFHKLSQAEFLILKQEFELKQEFAVNRIIKSIPISCKAVKEDAFKELFSQEEIVNRFLFDFKNVPPHEISRYIKVGKIYRYFIKNTDIHSFLCLLNKFPKKDSADNFSKKKLYDILSKIREIEFGESEEESSKKIKDEITILRSNDYDKEIIRINNNLKTGKKVFLLSTYQTIGAGQNIQYEFHEDIPVVPIHNQPYGNKEKDYDAIYLEKPTHLLSHFSKGKKISEEDMFKYFFEIEYLYDSGVIDTKEKKSRIEFAFKRKHNNNLPKPSNYELELTQVVSQHYCRIIMQAVGRLSRTKYKSPITHILYDREIKKYLMAFNLKQELVVPEFLALHQHCNKSIISTKKGAEQQISLVNKHNSLYLSRQVRELVLRIPNWNKREVKFWNKLRQFVLRNPTISKSKLEKSGLLRFYIKSPDNESRNRYYFSTKDDFKNDLNISFDDKIGREMSFEKIELNNILECEGLTKYFEKNNWANEFKLNEFIMSPPLFKNIYLGALGEEIGKYLIEKFIPSVKLSELDIGEYELFDYKINDETYIDLKFWTERYNGEDNLAQQQKIKRKMQKCSAKKVFIINILNENYLNEPIIGTNGIIQIPRLLNLRKGKIDTSSISNIIKHL